MPRNEKSNPNKPYINYLSKDFTELKKDLIKYAKSYFPNSYKDFNETSPGMMMMEMSAYVGDVLNFYIDQQFKEMFLPTVEERVNVINLAKTLGYHVKPTVPALVELEFSQIIGATGDGPNKTPHMVSASVLEKGTAVQSDYNGVTFQTLDIVDFNLTGSNQPTVNEIDTTTGVPTSYVLKTKAIAVSAEEKTMTFKVDNPKPFTRLTIPDKDVISIVSVVDSNKHKWHQVDYLAQDKIYKDTHWSDINESLRNGPYDDDSDGETVVVSTAVPFKLNDMETVNRRYVIETNADNTTSLIFGNGMIRSNSDNTDFLEEVMEDNVNMNSLILGNLPAELNPTVDYRSLGESPSNTTLSVTYRVGGGIKTNVPAESIKTINSKISLLPSYNNESFNTISVINTKEAAGGADEESIDEIRERAKAHFSAQRRAVTKEDYESRVMALPSRFGNIAKVYVSRKAYTEHIAGDVFDLNSDLNVGGSLDAQAFEDMINQIASEGNTDSHTDTIANLKQWIDDLESKSITDLATFKNLNMYVLSYNDQKQLIKTPGLIKENLRKYLAQFKIISDDVHIKDGRVVNFGLKFSVIARPNINKSELKVRCIDAIKEYFTIDNMDFQQEIYIADLENLLYNVEGVKVVEYIKITQNSTLLEIGSNLYADTGVPSNQVAGTSSEDYGWAYEFDTFTDGVVPPPHVDNPGVFELKNPLDNIKGEVK